ncbi:MAG: aldo/keto reductase [Longimicrobiales bacterium]
MTEVGPDWRSGLPDVIRGCWQLSEDHGSGWTEASAHRALTEAAERGELVLDMGDIYTGVEALVGGWLRTRPDGAARVRIHTKCVPDLDALASLDRDLVRRTVHRSLRRLGVDSLDLVQLHWWDFSVPGWTDAAEWLCELEEEGDVRAVGVTNFDAPRLATLLDGGLRIVSNQVQFSLLDRRPASSLAPLCAERGVALLCYGTLAGGLLTESWRRQPWPPQVPVSRSLAKYRVVVDEVGGWAALQQLLDAVASVAGETGRSFAEVCGAYVRHQRSVASVVLGLSRGRAHAWPKALAALSPEHIRTLEAALPNPITGVVYEAERDMDGAHGKLMRYDLGSGPE